MSKQRVPILVYHHIYADGDVSGTASQAGVETESRFRQHLQYIVDEGWTVVTTSQIIDWLIDDSPLPEKAVGIHFDNGWLDTYTRAMPILQEFNMTGTCFVITDGLEAATAGQEQAVRTQTEGEVTKPFMTWEQAGEMLAAGWEIGAHTATHCKVADTYHEKSDRGVLWEIETSNALIAKHLGVAPKHFAYPSGSRCDETDALLADKYRSLRLWHFEHPIQWRWTDRSTSRLAIECQNIDVRVSMDEFKAVFDGALDGTLDGTTDGTATNAMG